ncbi:MAG: thiolase family protein [Candidatus Thermoplasmatota archaeon]|nr:thiolase family protein [Candidatus Thermoplasmatota archaeon]
MSSGKKKIVIAAGIRTPFARAWNELAGLSAIDLGKPVVTGLCDSIDPGNIDGLIWGNVIQSIDQTNMARILSMKSGLDHKIPAYTVSINCASGMLAVTSAADSITLGRAQVLVAGGSESMSNAYVRYPSTFLPLARRIQRSGNVFSKLASIMRLRWRDVRPVTPSFRDPICGLSMGETTELLAKEYSISRSEQDRFAQGSQEKAISAQRKGRFKGEITPMAIGKGNKLEKDMVPRSNSTMEKLASLKPIFDKKKGTVTAGNSSPVTDGAAGMLVMESERAHDLGLKDLVTIKDYHYCGLDPKRMGLGPAHAVGALLERNKLSPGDFDIFEINEAFAAQVLASLKALDESRFCRKELGLARKVGEIPVEKMNFNGGAIALGHPLGATGSRLIITAARELWRRKKERALIAMCVSGGLGAGMILERVD